MGGLDSVGFLVKKSDLLRDSEIEEHEKALLEQNGVLLYQNNRLVRRAEGVFGDARTRVGRQCGFLQVVP